MKTWVPIAAVAAAIMLGGSPVPAESGRDLEAAARQATSENKQQAALGIIALRNAGPAGLQALLAENEATLKVRPVALAGLPGTPDAGRARLNHALNEVGGQYDNWASRLYWYNDLGQAKAAARASGKPILALYMLGKLNEEYSCANSRLFRTVLYPNPAINNYLRDRFVLCWQMVRPVPRVTIDFGDGRKIETTITGNSIHYVLDSQGRPVDGIPGMYGPPAFLRALQEADGIALQCSAADDGKRLELLQTYHTSRLRTKAALWTADLLKIGLDAPADPAGALLAMAAPPLPATRLRPVSQPTSPNGKLDYAALTLRMDETWARLAELHLPDAAIDPMARSVIDSKGSFGLVDAPSAVEAAAVTVSKVMMDRPLLRNMLGFQRTLAQDTVRNEYMLRAGLHNYLAAEGAKQDVSGLNKWVYASLFLSPDTDPWLGLLPRGAYTGLPNDGAVLPPGGTPGPSPATTENRAVQLAARN